MGVLYVQNLNYSYPGGPRVLSDINLTLKDQGFYWLAGPTGAGKSTLCLALAGLIPSSFGGQEQGEIILDSLGPLAERQAWELLGHIGIVFDNPLTQLSGIKTTVFEEVAFGLENMGLPRSEIYERVEDVLSRLHLESLKDRPLLSLSGGEQQKVAIASVVVMNPKFLILDEPTSQLDPLGRKEIYLLLENLRRKGITIFCVDHNIEEVAEHATHMFVMDQGKIIHEGPPQEIFRGESWNKDLIGSPIYLEAAGESLRLNIIINDGALPVTFKQAVDWFEGR